MPIYEYQVADGKRGCEHCRAPFERLERMSDEPLKKCPECGAPVHRIISAHAVGGSQSSADDRAKNAGFHKLKKLGKGEYEKQY